MTGATDPKERYHGLDLLRAVAMLLGLVIHAPLVYVLPEIAEGFGLRGVPPAEPWSMALSGWIHQWRMPAFFLLAGFFAVLVLQKKGSGAFAKDRLVRIGLALCLFFIPYDLLDGRLDGTLMHLWFLYYLLPMCLAAAFIHRFGVPLRIGAWPAARVWTWPIYLLALIPLSIAASGGDGSPDIPDRFGDFELAPFLYFGAWFALGAALFERRDVLDRLARWPLIGTTALLGTVTMIANWQGAHALSAVSTLAWVLCLVGVAHKSLSRRNAWVDWLIELSYPIYLLHILPAIFLGAGFVALGLPQIVAIPLTVVLGFVISAVGYYAFIKYTPLNWVVNGYAKSRFRWPMRRAPA